MTRADAIARAHTMLRSGEFLKQLDRRAASQPEDKNPEKRDRRPAHNKGPHSNNMGGVRAVQETRGGKLGFNVKFIIETGEEIGSPDLPEVCRQLRDELKADLLLASDGPRLSAERPTLFLGCRGGIRIHLDVNLRDGGHHSGNWGGVVGNPATILT